MLLYPSFYFSSKNTTLLHTLTVYNHFYVKKFANERSTEMSMSPVKKLILLSPDFRIRRVFS